MAALLVVGLWLSSGNARYITRANFDRIKQGMPAAEVNRLLGGGPPGRWDIVWYTEAKPTDLPPANTISVQFSDGKVISKAFQPWTAADLWRQLGSRLSLCEPAHRVGAVHGGIE